MCGINGFSTYGGSAKGRKDLIEAMNKKIQHRGPDQSGIFLDNNISLGHTRLSIIDLSEKGKQPIFNEDKSLCIIFNGEIYNFQELRKDLEKKGHRFYSKTDSEVILHLYEDYKEECLKYLNGIFAFAIWDVKNRELFLARDRIGVKPLYYYFKDGKFIFSSEIKAILEHNIKREVNLEALNHYFRLMYVPAPLTMFKDIYKLPQGHYLCLKFDAGRVMFDVRPRKYWDITDFSNIKSKEEIIEKIQELMKQSVKGQLISDRPVGIFLSGGIDSTSVLGMACEILKNHPSPSTSAEASVDKRAMDSKVKTFSVGFDINDPNNKFNADLNLARKTSKFYNTEHHELMVNSKNILENIEKVVYHMDEPIAEPTQTATFLLSKLAKKEVAVVLGGDGGDELFGGYKRYYYSYLFSKYGLTKIFPFLKSWLHTRFMFQEESEIGKILNRDINQPQITKQFFKDNYFNSDGRIRISEARRAKERFSDAFMVVDLKTWLVDESLMRTDKMTMAHGLEQRVPILDHCLIELAMKIPTKFKINSKEEGKAIFKEAMAKYLPKHILELEKKKVWLTPMSHWLRGDLNKFALDILSSDYFSGSKKYFNFDGVKMMFEDHVEKRKYNLNLIWALITFQLFSKKFNCL